MRRNQLIVTTLLLSVTVLIISCRKDADFKKYYGKSGIWEIETLKVDYMDSNGKTDSSRSYSNCGMFIFYNVDIGVDQKEYNGQTGITTYEETHRGFSWYPDGDNLIFRLVENVEPLRVYSVSGKGDKQTWVYSGWNYNFLPGNSPKVSETITVQRVKTR